MQDGEVGISVRPQGKKLLILIARGPYVAGERITPSQSQVRQYCNRIANHGAAMVQRLLKLAAGPLRKAWDKRSRSPPAFVIPSN